MVERRLKLKPRTFNKDIRRSMRRSFARFIAITAITALGAGFYAGLNAVAPDMRLTMDRYCDDANMMDIRLVSTLGFTEEDVAEIAKTEGIDEVMAGYATDAMSVLIDKEQVVKVHSLPADISLSNAAYLNRPVLLEGRMPKSDNECLISSAKMVENEIPLGSIITLDNEDGSLDDTLALTRFEVVGVVRSAYYVSFTLGTSAMGNGTVSRYIYVPEGAFNSEVYTDIHATVRDTAPLDCFSDEYKDAVEAVTDRLETLADGREGLRYDEVYTEARAELDDAKAELNDAKHELADAKVTLAEEREKADRELADAYKELTDGQKELDDAEGEIVESQNKLIDAEAQYKDGLSRYNDGLAQYESGMRQVEAGFSGIWTPFAQNLISTLGLTGDVAAEVSEGRSPGYYTFAAPLDTAYATAYAQANNLPGFVGTLDTLNATRLQLEAAKQTLDATKSQLDYAGWAVSNGWAEWNKGYAEYLDGIEEIKDGWIEYYDGKAEAEREIADAEQEIADAEIEIADGENEIKDAEIELADLEDCSWYVLTRDENVGFASFTGDADRMASLGTVFPVMFFLVAALVALTTMTRMVDEERIIIGTYKALGYSDGKIISKYLLYALWATVAGAAVGVLIGFFTLPEVCWNSYLLVYTAPKLISVYRVDLALEGLIASAVCTLGSTYFACRSALKEWPSTLMLPKAPPMGKRIFLERIGFIWKRMSFIWKVTFRNLFRYKKRLIMTVVGIAGCTGLMLTGFGIKDSISAILDIQFDEIYKYDTTITLSDDELAERSKAALESNFTDYLYKLQKAADLSANGNEVSGYISVPESAERMNDFVDFRSRVGHVPVTFAGGGAVITEKAARELGVGVGDTVSVKIGDDERYSFTVGGITENYVYHYLYISPELYESATGEDIEYNEIIAKCSAENAASREGLLKKLLTYAEFSTVSFSEDTIVIFSDMIKSLDMITLVLIFCAGALAFVVLYNLTNINISERIRELATIKVLGFRDGETAAYIFRETALLSLMGDIIGLGLGVIMHSFVITTVEMDMMMFGRNINPDSFVWSFALTLVFTVIVDLFMLGKLKKINMVESLKSVD